MLLGWIFGACLNKVKKKNNGSRLGAGFFYEIIKHTEGEDYVFLQAVLSLVSCLIALPNVQGSDTTGGDSSTKAGNKNTEHEMRYVAR